MTRLEVRLDEDRRYMLEELAKEKEAPISDVVRALIDDAYEVFTQQRRVQAAKRLISLEVEDMPEPDELSRHLAATYEPGGID